MPKGIYELKFYTIEPEPGRILHHWKVTAPNGERIGKSEQPFASKQAAKDNYILLASLVEENWA